MRGGTYASPQAFASLLDVLLAGCDLPSQHSANRVAFRACLDWRRCNPRLVCTRLRRNICTLAVDQRSECEAERMPPHKLLHPCSTCCWPDVIFHRSIRPIGLRSVLVWTGEDVIPVLSARDSDATYAPSLLTSVPNARRNVCLPTSFCIPARRAAGRM